MKYAITGGIGSGKSHICRLLQKHGIDIYDCDAAAKRLMRTSHELQKELQALVGVDVFVDGILQKAVLAKYILSSEANALAVDDIIHPAVARDFETSGCDWIESAIYFDSGFYRRVKIDKVVCVTAPLEVRISRIMSRDSISREKALEWIARQLPQEEVVRRSDYEIVNDGQTDIDAKVAQILEIISTK